jgi:N-methylhydantoinase A/oxoprolinase/acetone carboxylase beta subunit
LTSDLKYDQMRTVFMVEDAVDAAVIDAALDEISAELRQRLAEDGVADSDVQITAGLDCRYVGQGYELRVALPDGRFTDDAFPQFRQLHEQEYGHAFPSPVEIVNLRVTGTGVRAKVARVPVSHGTLDEALLGQGDGVFRVDGALVTLPTRYFARAKLPLDAPFEGPAVVFQRDTTTVIPPGWRGCAQASGNLILSR